jgi:ferredoxin-like protein FixX
MHLASLFAQGVEFKMKREHPLPKSISQALENCQRGNGTTLDITSIKSTFKYRNCSVREVLSSDKKFCEICPPGTYSKLSKSRSSFECVHCPNDRAICKYGRIWPHPGYWRIRNETDEKFFQKCPRPSACT